MHCLVRPGRFGLMLLAALITLGSGPEPAWGQDEQWAITFGAGIGRPTGGHFGEEWRNGSSVMLTVARVSGSHMDFGGEFGYFSLEPTGDSVAVPGTRQGENDWEMWRLRFRARRMFASPEARLAPFVIAGAGVYPITVNSEDSTGLFKVTHTGMGGSLGIGADFRAGESVHFGLEAQYHYIRVSEAEVGYKAAPLVEVLFALRWLPQGGGG